MDNALSVSVAQTMAELSGLVENLLLLLSDKEKVVITKRFGICGFQKATLEEIGKDFSVTRERVRQIEKNALSKMQRNVFNTALKSVHEFSSVLIRQHGGLLREKTLVDNFKSLLPPDFKIDEGSVKLALSLHDGITCVGNTINFYPHVRVKEMSEYSLKYASGHLINQLHKYGNVKDVKKIHSDLKKVFDEVGFDVVKVKSLVSIDKRLTVIDEDFVGLLEWRHIHPRTLRDKIMYILRKERKPMHFVDIAQRISEAKFDGRSVNLQAVHNELIRYGSFVLIGRGIYALQEWGYEKGTVSDVIEEILTGKKELSSDKIVDFVLQKRQVKKITILLALKNGKKFERVGRNVYRLRV